MRSRRAFVTFVLMRRASVTEKCAAESGPTDEIQQVMVRRSVVSGFMVLLGGNFTDALVTEDFDPVRSGVGWNIEFVGLVGWLG